MMTEFTNPITGDLLTAVLLDARVPQNFNPAGEFTHYSRHQQYNCNCHKIGHSDKCDEKGYRQYRILNADGIEVCKLWICAIHEQICGIGGEGELEIVHEVTEIEIPTQDEHGNEGTTMVQCNGGCLNMLVALNSTRGFFGRIVKLAENNDDFLARWKIMEEEGFWDHLTPGSGRGCEFLVGNTWQYVKDLIRENLPHLRDEFERMEEADGKRFYVVLAAGYVGNGRESKSEGHRIMFYKHCDRLYFGKQCLRTNITFFDSSTAEDGRPKCTRFSNRVTGQWISIISPHGFFLEGDHYVYGCDDSHEIEHAVYDAKNTVTITIDHGPRDNSATQVEINRVADEVHGDNNNGDNDDEEGQGDAQGDAVDDAVDDSDYFGENGMLHLPHRI